MGMREDWRDWRYEDWILERRSAIAGGVTVLIVLLTAAFLRVLFWGPWLGLTPLVVIEGILAIGTFALAYAALVQAISAEKKRHYDRVPNLDLEFIQQPPPWVADRTESVTTTDFLLPTG